MTRDMFQVVGDSLVGRGLSFDVGALGLSKQEASADKLRGLVDMANVIYKQGRESAQLSYDDRYAMHGAVEALRALAVVVGTGTPMGDRYRRCADIVARLLQEQQG